MKTFFRLVVMLVSLAILWKGWQLYGPPADQLKSIASRAIEIAERTLEGGASSDGATLNPDDPRTTAPPVASDAAPPTLPALPLAAVPDSPVLLPTGDAKTAHDSDPAHASAAESAGDEAAAPSTEIPESSLPESPIAADRNESQLEATLARLEQLGIHDHQLQSWGAGGKLYRFSCRAPWGEAAGFSRHFESVAAEPLAAVEAVAAKVDQWRALER